MAPQPSSSLRSVAVSACIVLFGALPATVLALPAMAVFGFGLEKLGGEYAGEGALLVLWSVAGVLGAIGLWLVVLLSERSRVALGLVACGVVACGALVAEGLRTRPDWFFPRTLGKDTAELALLLCPLLVGVFCLVRGLWRRATP